MCYLAADAHRLWQTVQRERVTDIVIVGDAFAKPMLRALEEAEARGEPYDLSSVRLIVSSGVIWSSAVKLHPAVWDCLVVGVPDEKFGEAVTAVVSLRTGQSATEAEILANSRGQLSSYKLPKRILLVEVVRRAPNGKADYAWAKGHALASLGLD